jgi:hypothetical protein
MSQPARQKRLRALRADQRLTAGDPRLPLPEFLGDRRLFLAAIAQHSPIRGLLGRIRHALDATEHHQIVAHAANANANAGREKC